jgi:hypothetical protein
MANSAALAQNASHLSCTMSTVRNPSNEGVGGSHHGTLFASLPAPGAIAYVTFGSEAPSINGSSVFADNFTAVPGPIGGAGLRGLILAGGGPVIAQKGASDENFARKMLEFGQSL